MSSRKCCACVQGSEEDIEMADAPDEFVDPITNTIMQDPVKLPSGLVMDRPNVLRMLLSDPRDPTTRYVLNHLNFRDALSNFCDTWHQTCWLAKACE